MYVYQNYSNTYIIIYILPIDNNVYSISKQIIYKLFDLYIMYIYHLMEYIHYSIYPQFK